MLHVIMVFLPTLGNTWPHLKVNVGKKNTYTEHLGKELVHLLFGVPVIPWVCRSQGELVKFPPKHGG